jgi:hypothetical protein
VTFLFLDKYLISVEKVPIMRAREFTKNKISEGVDELFEINMSPKNLERLVADIPGARVGIEFEMVVPGIGNPDNDDFDSEPDMDADERVYDIDDVITFFDQGDVNPTSDIRRLRESLEEKFNEWVDQVVEERWERDRREIVSDYIVNNDLESEKEEDEDFDEFLDRKLEDDDFVNEVREEWRDEQYGDFDQGDFFSDQRWTYASDVYNDFASVSVLWPIWTEAPEGGSIDADDIVKDFGQTLGVKVLYSERYHGAKSSSTLTWRVEPDGSIDPGASDDVGLEFITPHRGLPLDEMITKMEEVRAWALANDCYTNRSTGLHINVSVPNTSMISVDYVKLVLLLGDQYVLDMFGRSANTFAKSSYKEIVSRIQSNPAGVTEVLDKMKKYLAHLGAQSIHNGSTNKYVSVNFKGDYVEFRSPGGDWLNETYWNQVKNTIFRFVVALDAATKPDKYKEEYLKKLYKLIAPPGKEPELDILGKMIAGYLSGEVSKNDIIQRYTVKRYAYRNKESPISSELPTTTQSNTPANATNLPPRNTEYIVYMADTNLPIGTFLARANDAESARLGFNSFLTRIGRSSPAGYGYREVRT